MVRLGSHRLPAAGSPFRAPNPCGVSARAYRANARAARSPGRRRKPSPARAYRVGPRRSARGRGGSRIDWDRAGRIALVLVLFLIVVLYINPIVGFVDAWQESEAEQANLERLERTNEELRKRVAILGQPDGAEREARKLGMVAEGERAYVVRGLREK
jgi:cell division protein FtsB